ncbi:hypothetical protein JHD49_04385 [Sulfurimonas sp. SAG-AH-194-C21]|nr:hypothetical protein [Sulfurimonas sp. SAG-AH-194-C21]MDF1883169.1 hypothetical protein [Sulfurimonas sp. SAG-AH-194-C21]
MKKLIITSLSILALATMFTGCGSSGSVASLDSSINDAGDISTPPAEVIINNGDTTDTTITNEFGLNPTLGNPPPLPAS